VSIMSTIYEWSRYQVMATESMHCVGVSTTTAILFGQDDDDIRN
jgi:hypothetical protein